MATKTRNSVPWKLREGPATSAGALSQAQIEHLASEYVLDVATLNHLSRQLDSALSIELNLSQPELRQPKIRKAVIEAEIAVKALRAAEKQILKATEIVRGLHFKSLYPYLRLPSPGIRQVEILTQAQSEIAHSRAVLEQSAKEEMLTIKGLPDGRAIRDWRRNMVCVALFNTWLENERKLTYTTDPLTSKRGGQLFSFVNAVVGCITDPPRQLKDDTIKRELEEFISLCTEEAISGMTI